ncbi:MAG: hypothetical protein NT112_02685 [Methanoregula sp.]|nr:hypothetical protein [Methanoregula sp.]
MGDKPLSLRQRNRFRIPTVPARGSGWTFNGSGDRAGSEQKPGIHSCPMRRMKPPGDGKRSIIRSVPGCGDKQGTADPERMTLGLACFFAAAVLPDVAGHRVPEARRSQYEPGSGIIV